MCIFAPSPLPLQTLSVGLMFYGLFHVGPVAVDVSRLPTRESRDPNVGEKNIKPPSLFTRILQEPKQIVSGIQAPDFGDFNEWSAKEEEKKKPKMKAVRSSTPADIDEFDKWLEEEDDQKNTPAKPETSTSQSYISLTSHRK